MQIASETIPFDGGDDLFPGIDKFRIDVIGHPIGPNLEIAGIIPTIQIHRQHRPHSGNGNDLTVRSNPKLNDLIASIQGFMTDTSGRERVENTDYLVSSASCQDAEIGFLPLESAFAGFDDLDRPAAVRTNARTWPDRTIEPFVAAFQARHSTFSDTTAIVVKAMPEGPFFLLLRDR